MTPTIRPELPADRAAVSRVHERAFGRAAEARLVDELRAGGFVRAALVAEVGGDVVGHVVFGALEIVTAWGEVPGLFLAPLAVVPEHQRQGIGAALVRAGLDVCRAAGHGFVVVLGHADYYPRFGFAPALAAQLDSPFRGRDSWMAAELSPGALAGVTGRVRYPPPFGIE
jgi:putative acetyltransferase